MKKHIFMNILLSVDQYISHSGKFFPDKTVERYQEEERGGKERSPCDVHPYEYNNNNKKSREKNPKDSWLSVRLWHYCEIFNYQLVYKGGAYIRIGSQHIYSKTLSGLDSVREDAGNSLETWGPRSGEVRWVEGVGTSSYRLVWGRRYEMCNSKRENRERDKVWTAK